MTTAKKLHSNGREVVVSTVVKSFWIIVLLSAFGATAWAGVHPVPLDPKQDPATCAQCHEDKTKGKSVHSAIAMGCTSLS